MARQGFIKSTAQFQSSDGVHLIQYYIYTPSAAPKGVVQICHGMCEYLERYEDFAAALCGQGFLVCGNDHLGHGRLAQESGDLGYFGGPGSFARLSEDAHLLTLLVKKQYPGLPFFLLGHSMGSFVARHYLTRYGEELTGVVIMGTNGGNPFAGLGIFLSRLIIRLHGEKYISPLLDKLSMGGNNRRFRAENDPQSWLTRDAAVRQKYAGDPRCSFTFTAAGYRELFSLLSAVSAPDWAKKVPKQLPIFLVSGEDDPIGDYGRGVKKVFDRLKDAGADQVTLKLYPGGRHEILNETNKAEIYQDLIAFFERPC